ncbi:MAG: polyprenyl synthetase family protein [Candidatus Odinarchaeum yellowstonii]|uniref:Polyprenyl synthetase family protein n=1 Tax=Odinarchaeota yellowstonii (strain LCB_4) TaxID=1841599 RepID=A0AAF0D134_ODILC|nr:MAG: polyprenyl synthetase family protein [Candidatus Odinarchaeum yellowstonii]
MKINVNTISSNAFLTRFEKYQRKLDKAILTELNKRKDSVFYEPLRNIMRGGKRLRPILLLLSFESVAEVKLNPLPAAVAVELIHLGSLIHDDIVDRDSMRRGRAAFHILYGYEMAILGADFILSMILDITTLYEDRRIAKALALATSRMCEGQIEEILAYKKREKLSFEEYVNIVYKKTASLFEASASIGAILGGAEEEEVKSLSDFGKMIGLAYQIRDDLTDLASSKINNLLMFLNETEHIQAISNSYILEAKNNLEKLKDSGARNLLLELANYVDRK